MSIANSDLLKQFVRQFPAALDSTNMWHSKAEAQNYATNNPTAYAGQILSYLDSGAYKIGIIQSDKTIKDLPTRGIIELTITSFAQLDTVRDDGYYIVNYQQSGQTSFKYTYTMEVVTMRAASGSPFIYTITQKMNRGSAGVYYRSGSQYFWSQWKYIDNTKYVERLSLNPTDEWFCNRRVYETGWYSYQNNPTDTVSMELINGWPDHRYWTHVYNLIGIEGTLHKNRHLKGCGFNSYVTPAKFDSIKLEQNYDNRHYDEWGYYESAGGYYEDGTPYHNEGEAYYIGASNYYYIDNIWQTLKIKFADDPANLGVIGKRYFIKLRFIKDQLVFARDREQEYW